MARNIFLGVLVAAGIAVIAATQCHAQAPPVSVSPYRYQALSPYQQITISSSVSTLTVPTGATIAEICNEGGAVRYRDDGTAPTATVGIPVAAGSATAPFCFAYSGPLAAIEFIQQAGGAGPLDVSYYR